MENLDEQIREKLNSMAKPHKSLGITEGYIIKIVKALNHIPKELKPYHIIFAGINDIASPYAPENLRVTNYTSELTSTLVNNVENGTAVISCFCQSMNIPYTITSFAEPSKSFASKPIELTALKPHTMVHVSERTEAVVSDIAKVSNLISFGEIGIGNTTISSAVLYSLTGRLYPSYGTAYPAENREEIRNTKKNIIVQNVKMTEHPYVALSLYGSYELWALYVAMKYCAEIKVPFVIDGLTTAVAFMCACMDDPNVLQYGIPSHQNHEEGLMTALMCAGIRRKPPLHLGFALGEGTGAVLMSNILRTVYHAVMNSAKL